MGGWETGMRDVGMLYLISMCWVLISALIVLYLCICVFVYFLFDLRECHIWYLYNLARCSYQDPHYIIAQNITRSATFLNFHCLNQLVKAGGGSRACSLQLSNHLVCSDHPSHAFPGQQGIPSVFSVQCSVFSVHPLNTGQQGIPHPSVNEALIFAGESTWIDYLVCTLMTDLTNAKSINHHPNNAALLIFVTGA